jgi:hypothetical protein
MENKAKWWMYVLKVLSVISIGAVLGGFTIGTLIALFIGPTYTAGIIGGVLGIIGYCYYMYKNSKRLGDL